MNLNIDHCSWFYRALKFYTDNKYHIKNIIK